MIYGVNKKVQKILEKFDLWRKSQGYSQQEIADAIGWDRSKVNRVLQGKQDSSYFLSKIEQVFGNIDEVKAEEVIRDDNYRLKRKS
jgi:transcriptional regulator with XRE-family HTH domain